MAKYCNGSDNYNDQVIGGNIYVLATLLSLELCGPVESILKVINRKNALKATQFTACRKMEDNATAKCHIFGKLLP